LCHPLGDLGVTHRFHLWHNEKRVVDFLLVLIVFFSPALTVEALWANIGRNCGFWKGAGHFEHHYTNDFWHPKTRVHGLPHGIVCVILRLAVLIQYRRVSYRQTDRHTMMANISASLAPRAGKYSQTFHQTTNTDRFDAKDLDEIPKVPPNHSVRYTRGMKKFYDFQQNCKDRNMFMWKVNSKSHVNHRRRNRGGLGLGGRFVGGARAPHFLQSGGLAGGSVA